MTKASEIPVQEAAGIELAEAQEADRGSLQVADLIILWLKQVASSSARSYKASLADFARMLDLSVEAAVATVLVDARKAGLLAERWRGDMLDRKLAPKTINARLAALRSLVKYAGESLHLISWRLLVKDVKTKRIRDTRGPGTDGVRRLLAAACEVSSARDRVIVRMMFAMALRRYEVAGLDIEHVESVSTLAEAKGARLFILGKGDGEHESERTARTMPTRVREDLAAWLRERGTEPGPLFVSVDRWGNKGGRLPVDAINDIVYRLAKRAGIKARPHGLRHAGITEAVRQSNGDMRKVQEFSRHADLRTVAIYVDDFMDEAGELSEMVDGTGDEADSE